MPTHDEPDEVARQGEAIYESLRPILEPEYNGKAVAIHLPSGNYVVDHNWAVARRKVREQHPEGKIYSVFVGPPTEREHRLTERAVGAGRKA